MTYLAVWTGAVSGSARWDTVYFVEMLVDPECSSDAVIGSDAEFLQS